MLEQLKEARGQAAALLAFLDKLLEQASAVVQVPVNVGKPVGLQKQDAFWDYIRGDKGELFPTITTEQVQGIERLLRTAAGLFPLAWMAYLLATVYHETAKRMQPVREGLDVSDAWRQRNLRYYPWYGRGDVQLTWEYNYKFATDRLRELGYADVDLIANPDQALDPRISALIVVHGMLEGWFTKKKLNDFIPVRPSKEHYINARRIINGTDKAELIAGYAVEFEKALRLGDWR